MQANNMIIYFFQSMLFVILSFIVCYSSSAEETTVEQQHPKTCQEAVELVINNIDEESKQLLLSIEKEELQSRRFITGWGKGIRDGFGLNDGNFALMQSCQNLRDDATFHPINISGIIMEEVWEAIRK